MQYQSICCFEVFEPPPPLIGLEEAAFHPFWVCTVQFNDNLMAAYFSPYRGTCVWDVKTQRIVCFCYSFTARYLVLSFTFSQVHVFDDRSVQVNGRRREVWFDEVRPRLERLRLHENLLLLAGDFVKLF